MSDHEWAGKEEEWFAEVGRGQDPAFAVVGQADASVDRGQATGRFMRRLIILLVIPIAVLFDAAGASAALRTASVVYYCTSATCAATQAALEPPAGPAFNPTPPPTITPYLVSIAYDPVAGVLTYSEGGTASSYPFPGCGSVRCLSGAYRPVRDRFWDRRSTGRFGVEQPRHLRA